MSWPDLPNELQIQILNHLGTPFFREDISRLTVCKAWYTLAECVIKEDVHLGAKGLLNFLNPPLNETREAGIPEWAKTQTRRLMISVDSNLKTYDKSVRDHETWARYRPLARGMRESFEYIQKSLHEFKKLEEFTVRFHSLRTYSNSDPTEVKADGPNLYYLVAGVQLPGNLQHLSSLELDLCSYGVNCDLGSGWCSHLNGLLGSLRRLRLRLTVLCTRLLRVDPDMPEKLVLEDLIINTDLRISQFSLESECVTFCGDRHSFDPSIDDSDFLDAAKLIVRRMSNPKIVRFLWRAALDWSSACSDEVVSDVEQRDRRYSYDCLTRKRMKLQYDASWSDDGDTDSEDLEWDTSEDYSDDSEEDESSDDDDDDDDDNDSDEIDGSSLSGSESWEDTNSDGEPEHHP